MVVLRLGSLNALDTQRRIGKWLKGLIGPILPSADTVGRVYAQMHTPHLREMISHVAHRLGRNKALHSESGLRFVAVDGHEFFSQ